MDKTLQLLVSETRSIMGLVQKSHSLLIVKRIIETHPERITEFGFSQSDFLTLDDDIASNDNKCKEWWDMITKKYSLPEDSRFQVSFENNTITII